MNMIKENYFYAPIEHLQRLVKLYPEGFDWGEQCKAAIRLLEAAGKMNEAHATTISADMIVRVPITKWQADLLSAAALPDKELK